MLINPPNLPMGKGGIPWGSIILAAIIIGGVSYVGYHTIIAPELTNNKNPKS